MAKQLQQGQVFVGVFLIENDIIVFDFGDSNCGWLAITFERDPEGNLDRLTVYSGEKNYREGFMKGTCERIDEELVNIEVISIEGLMEIDMALISIDWKKVDKKQLGQLWNFLRKYFPTYTRDYGYKY